MPRYHIPRPQRVRRIAGSFAWIDHRLLRAGYLAVIRSQGELRRFYQKKRKRGLHHLSAVTATAIKVTRAVWRVCTDQRDYLPAGRPDCHS